MDSSVPDIEFDAGGVCNYCDLHATLDSAFPNDARGARTFDQLVDEIKAKGRNRKYDCVVGVSGGTDSTFLIHLAKERGLRPLAVHLDNGWDSEISVSNIKNALELLDVDLYTHVVEWEEMKDILVSFLKASVPWVDGPTDIAILACLYKTAARYGAKYIWVGNNFRTEGRQPNDWTHCDGRMIRSIHRTFGRLKLHTFPNLYLSDLLYYGFVRGIKMIRPFYHIQYNKTEAKQLISQRYGWRDYGGHHHESLYTKFAICYWLTRKFGIDKRKVTYSALIRSGEMPRATALARLSEPPYDPKQMEEDKRYVLKKLELSEEDFEVLMARANKQFSDYPSYYPIYQRMRGLTKLVFRTILPWRPMMFYELKTRR